MFCFCCNSLHLDASFVWTDNQLPCRRGSMTRNPRPSAAPRGFSESSQQRFSTYALAATAAGVGMLALAPPAEASVVFTPAHVTIGPTGTGSYNLDLNHDGVVDFQIFLSSSCDIDRCFVELDAVAPQGGNQVAFGGHVQTCLALPAGAVIGPRRQFYGGVVQMAGYLTSHNTKRTIGNWVDVSNRFLGFQFQINGETHYGWARLSVQLSGGSVTGTLTGYAYQTVANRAIVASQTTGSEAATLPLLTAPAPQPASLALLAQGASGLVAWRREGL
jgi:hypothetical protein